MAGKVGWNPSGILKRGEGEKAPDSVSPVAGPRVSQMHLMIQNEQPLGGAQTAEDIAKSKV